MTENFPAPLIIADISHRSRRQRSFDSTSLIGHRSQIWARSYASSPQSSVVGRIRASIPYQASSSGHRVMHDATWKIRSLTSKLDSPARQPQCFAVLIRKPRLGRFSFQLAQSGCGHSRTFGILWHRRGLSILLMILIHGLEGHATRSVNRPEKRSKT